MTRVAALVLAAGMSRRFGAPKTIAEIGGVPLVRAAASIALRSHAVSVTVVTGHARAEVDMALTGLDVRLVHNSAFATGMAGSLKIGITTLSTDVDGTLVLLADMPFVRPATLDALISVFEDRQGEIDAVVPVFDSRRGNPVLIGRSLFDRTQTISGDEGARRLLSAPGTRLDLCEIDDPGVAIDIDRRIDLDSRQAPPPPSAVPLPRCAGEDQRGGS